MGIDSIDAALRSRLSVARSEMEASLWGDLIAPWFPRCVSTAGGFHQTFSEDWQPLGTESRSIVFQARMTWTVAKLGQVSKDRADEFRAYTRHGLDFLAECFIVPDSGAVKWSLGSDDQQSSSHLSEYHAYGSSFAIYALAAAAMSLRDDRALELAKSAFRWVEDKFYDSAHGGYHEVVDLEGHPILAKPEDPDAQDAIGTPYGQKSQNTHLHLLESYAELYRVWPNPQVKLRIAELLDILLRTLHHDEGWSDGFAYTDWSASPGAISYGHDIELVHLALDAAKEIGLSADVEILRRCRNLADYALTHGWDTKEGGFFNRGTPDAGVTDRNKIWWVQAEGLLGLAYLFDKTRDSRYAEAMLRQWEWIRTRQIDHQHGGWYEEVAPDGGIRLKNKGHAWKAAYHDGRGLLHTVQILNSLEAAG